jgi:uracil-DNA glycosylase family 4
MYRMGRDPQPQVLTIAKGVRQGEDFEGGQCRSAAFNHEVPLDRRGTGGPILQAQGIGPPSVPEKTHRDSVPRHDGKRAAFTVKAFHRLADEVHACRRCPRLVQWREERAADPPRRFLGESYWARPVSGFGDPMARVAIVGLAPAAHGANRTGRMFTGDRSGDWLYAALHRAGYANQPHSVRRDDGLRLSGVYVTAVVRCAPPANRPTPEERDTCLPFLERELKMLNRCRTVVALGAFAWDGALRALGGLGIEVPKPRPRFGHGAEAQIGDWALLGCYHPSQQNTFTGRLTGPMLDAIFSRAGELSG